MKYYSIFVQVDFDKPRTMPPKPASPGSWQAAGYFQHFYCTERSKEKAKKLVLNYIKRHEETLNYRVTFERVAWMRSLTNREEIDLGSGLTDSMFEKRNQIGIWFVSKKDFYISGSGKSLIYSISERFSGLWCNKAGRVLLISEKSNNT